ncbi:phosphonate C-P lyase system protein PhnG [Allopusillimonas ginsengisoli]|uniref:phosphonate C-P lyase system protein PhnG n=1 Tax=Allopusillimonas ginsengisoli TaxID=453575 RepID=UPI0010221833|nr:phosphonate C-P lyase system protein PhnG [Allopusillimonas ginsengisoli]TEA77279.1 phosphonate C-P lyase system protein PhnG [Allopusillimonas ginsengisoli]
MTNSTFPSVAPTTQRQRWMQILSRAGASLEAHSVALRAHGHRYVRTPETGMVMVRGRMGGDGASFNLGEMTVTRCVVQLDDGTTGHSYIAGRSHLRAELAALADALLQGAQAQYWQEALIAPLRTEQQTLAAKRAMEAAGTQVDFTTLVRGED